MVNRSQLLEAQTCVKGKLSAWLKLILKMEELFHDEGFLLSPMWHAVLPRAESYIAIYPKVGAVSFHVTLDSVSLFAQVAQASKSSQPIPSLILLKSHM
jgi:hypothetical protein